MEHIENMMTNPVTYLFFALLVVALAAALVGVRVLGHQADRGDRGHHR